MTALENVLVGRHVRMRQSPLVVAVPRPGFRRSEAEARGAHGELLEFVGLTRFDDELARNLPYGDQRRLEIARALATEPDVLLLDEPTAGMNPQETEADPAADLPIRDTGVSVVVIEHDTKFIFTLCDSVLVLVQGEVLVEGSPETVRDDPRVIEAYLGKPREEVEAVTRLAAAVRAPGGLRRVTLSRGRDLSVAYGAIEAVRGVSFSVEEGQIVCLIGANGAGKTTTLRTISGLLRPRARRHPVRGRADRQGARARDPRAGHRALPRGPAGVRADDRRGEPAARRVHPQRRGGGAGRHGAGVRAVPGAGGAADEEGGPVLRR